MRCKDWFKLFSPKRGATAINNKISSSNKKHLCGSLTGERHTPLRNIATALWMPLNVTMVTRIII